MHDASTLADPGQPSWRVRVAAACLIAPAATNDPRFLGISLDPQPLLGPERARRLDPLSQLALVAVDGAARRAGMQRLPMHEDRLGSGVCVGTALGTTATSVRYARRLVRAGAAATNPIDFPDSIDGAPAAHVAMDWGLGGPSVTFADGEQSALSALVYAARQIAWGRVTRMVVVVGDKLDAAFSCALVRDPRFLNDASGTKFLAAECVFALVLEAHCEPEFELIGFLDGFGDPADVSVADSPTYFLSQDGSGRMEVAHGANLGGLRLRDPSGALNVAAAWLNFGGPIESFGGAIEPVAVGPIAERIGCGMPHHSRLGFVRRRRP